jgi:hypothetical protein
VQSIRHVSTAGRPLEGSGLQRGRFLQNSDPRTRWESDYGIVSPNRGRSPKTSVPKLGRTPVSRERLFPVPVSLAPREQRVLPQPLPDLSPPPGHCGRSSASFQRLAEMDPASSDESGRLPAWKPNGVFLRREHEQRAAHPNLKDTAATASPAGVQAPGGLGTAVIPGSSSTWPRPTEAHCGPDKDHHARPRAQHAPRGGPPGMTKDDGRRVSRANFATLISKLEQKAVLCFQT